MDLLQVRNLNKIYPGKVSYKALTNIDLTIEKGEFVGIMGPSGSGKTTLLNVVSTIDRPTSGEVRINGNNPYDLSQEKLAHFRRRELGFVFQSFNLLDTMTVKENMLLPLTLDGMSLQEMKRRAESISEKLGIAHIMDKRTFEISGGQAQRTAIARALIHGPQLLLADEPTGNLDSKSARDVMELMGKLNKDEGATMMLVTHDAMAASYCDRVVFIKDGQYYTEVHCGDNRSAFYQKIINVLSLLGGQENEFPTVRV
ncbi:ABC transporter ATP-binding protein [Paenibacillus sp. GSMTC-2017]|uniref:ABC transporter ATP-binding protein n=1 Tax=Paenibacillus sp. GSMTC-2017 TaxID=2794350 RepID=UPI0018D7B39C|nr:ABC transporter ATP-binding protein [Paenibacillus sp. GSMTC-2017]MBH5317497.1 ABC transporter ATP-binding protein [Paenibacillus sp. GSMTC-2017]